MIAAVFVLVLALVIGVSSLMGGGAAVQVSQAVPWWALVAVVLAFVAFFAGGVYIGAALAVLALLAGFGLSDRPFWNFIGEMLWAPSTNFVLVSVPLFLLMGEIMLRAGLSDRLVPRAQCMGRPFAGRLVAHQHHVLRRVFGHRWVQRGHRRDHGLGGFAVF
jgi:C4-dicarboxylate transporter, DctM subunit